MERFGALMIKNKQKSKLIPQLLIITGVSGAGKSSALRASEDIGFEAIDNVPISLFGRLVTTGDLSTPLSIGVDIRTRDFNADTVLTKIDAIASKLETAISILFLDCDDEVLLRRFEETRRRHPLAINRSVIDGLKNERQLLKKLRNQADIILDTSEMKLGDLKIQISNHCNSIQKNKLSIFITSFGFRNGLPRNADLVFDVRFLKNPHYDLGLRALTGENQAIAEFITSDKSFSIFFKKLTNLLNFLLKCYKDEGKNYLTISFGCTGGKHRSVFVAEKLAEWLKNRNHVAQVHHRDL